MAVSNLFKWNSVAIQLDTEGDGAGAAGTGGCRHLEAGIDEGPRTRGAADPPWIRHIKAGSVRVKVGDRVALGDVVCESGGVGPARPHLHFCAFRSKEPTAPTTRAGSRGERGRPYVLIAGNYYDERGGPRASVGDRGDGRPGIVRGETADE